MASASVKLYMMLHARAKDDAERANLEAMLADMSETDRHAIMIELAAKAAEAEREQVFTACPKVYPRVP